MKNQKVTLCFEIENSISVIIANFKTQKHFKIEDVIALNPKHKRSLYFQVLDIIEDTPDKKTVLVKYFGSRKVMYRTSIYGASIIPIDDVKPNYNNVVASMLYSE